MKTVSVHTFFTLTSAALLVALGPSVPKAAASQKAPHDYLVRVGTRYMWASQADKLNPPVKYVSLSKDLRNDYLVDDGKRTVWASTLRRDEKDTKTRPSPHNKACRDYLVYIGKRAEWASSAQCSAGLHAKGTKPLCCVAAIGDAKKPPRCCKDAAGSCTPQPRVIP